MKTPDENPAGYAVSGVNNATGFHNADFLLAAGSGDDNGASQSFFLSSTDESVEPDASSPSLPSVHFANSASLIEKLTLAKVRRFQMRVYTDSNHGMNKVRGNFGSRVPLFVRVVADSVLLSSWLSVRSL